MRANYLARRRYSSVTTPAVLASLLGKTFDMIVPETSPKRNWAGFHRALASGSSFIDGQAVIVPVLSGDGQVHQLAGRL